MTEKESLNKGRWDMRNKKKLSLLTVVFIIISVFVGCRNNEVAKINKNMDEIIDEIKKVSTEVHLQI